MFSAVTGGGFSVRIAAMVSPEVERRERSSARQHFIQHDAETENVRTRVKGFSAHLFGRHIGERPDHRARLRRRPFFRKRFAFAVNQLTGRRGEFGDAEIENFHDSVQTNHNIFRFYIAMHDAGGVRGGERESRLLGNFERVNQRQFAAADSFAQSFALDKFGCQKMRVAFAGKFVNGQDIRMIERRNRLRLALETLEPFRVGDKTGGQNLERDRAIQLAYLAPDKPRPFRLCREV